MMVWSVTNGIKIVPAGHGDRAMRFVVIVCVCAWIEFEQASGLGCFRMEIRKIHLAIINLTTSEPDRPRTTPLRRRHKYLAVCHCQETTF